MAKTPGRHRHSQCTLRRLWYNTSLSKAESCIGQAPRSIVSAKSSRSQTWLLSSGSSGAWPARGPCRKVQCCLTPRSTGAPTAGHQARAGGTLSIFTGPGLASRRWRPVTSNVRRRKTPPLFSSRYTKSSSIGTAIWHTKPKYFASSSPLRET